jgi:hypothetical protein
MEAVKARVQAGDFNGAKVGWNVGRRASSIDSGGVQDGRGLGGGEPATSSVPPLGPGT